MTIFFFFKITSAEKTYPIKTCVTLMKAQESEEICLVKNKNLLICLRYENKQLNKELLHKLNSVKSVWPHRLSDLKVIAGLLAVGDPLDLGGRGEVEGLTQV